MYLRWFGGARTYSIGTQLVDIPTARAFGLKLYDSAVAKFAIAFVTTIITFFCYIFHFCKHHVVWQGYNHTACTGGAALPLVLLTQR